MSLQEIASAIDPLDAEPSLARLLGQHQWLPDQVASSLEPLQGRHNEETKVVRALWYNTFLLPGGPLGIEGKPDREARARELGQVLPGRYDLIGLAELFGADEERMVLFSGWGANVRYVLGGSGASGSSFDVDVATSLHDEPDDYLNGGCVTIAERSSVTITDAHWEPYGAEGGIDAWAGKGFLRSVIDAGGLQFLFITTHLNAGDVQTKHAQVNELQAFILEGWNDFPQLPVLLAGDFNLGAETPSDYDLLRSRMSAVGLRDVWAWRQPNAWGPTSPFDRQPNICLLNALDTQSCADDATLDGTKPGSRIDYIFLELPNRRHSAVLDVSQPRRIPFLRGDLVPPAHPERVTVVRRGGRPRGSGRGSGVAAPIHSEWNEWLGLFTTRPPALSDHLGLQFTVYVNAAGWEPEPYHAPRPRRRRTRGRPSH
jgi:hypothetical protein